MNMYPYIICIMGAFMCGLFAREVFDVGKMLIKNLRGVRVEIYLGRDNTTPREMFDVDEISGV